MRNGFWRQLCFLLWKNILIKKRQKVWLFIEFTMPLVLFAMLAIMRTKDYRVNKPLCHYDSKGLPSAGLLPFMHSFFCSFDNHCYRTPTTGDEGLYFNNATTGKDSLLVDLLYNGALQLRSIGEDPENFNRAIKVGQQIIDILASLKPTSLQGMKLSTILGTNDSDVTEMFLKMGATSAMASALGGAMLTPVFPLNVYPQKLIFDQVSNCIHSQQLLLFFDPKLCPLKANVFCDRSLFDESFMLPPLTKLNQTDYASLCPMFVTPEAAQRFQDLTMIAKVAKIKDTLKGHTQLMNLMASVRLVSEWIRKQPIANLPSDANYADENWIKQSIMCNKNAFDVKDKSEEAGGAKTVVNTFKDEIIKFIMSLNPKRKHTNETMCGIAQKRKEINCKLLDNDVKMNFFLPLLQGYILVSPPAPAVKRLVEKLEIPLRQFDALKNLMERWVEKADEVQEKLRESQLVPATKNLKELLHILDIYLPTDTKWMKELDASLTHMFKPPSHPSSFSAVTKRIAKMFLDITGCFATDRFRFVKSEGEMEEMANCLRKDHQYMSGIAFLNLSENATHFDPFTSYKIRHLPEFVDNTNYIEDNRKAPRGDPLKDLKYIGAGFSFLQERIDRLLIQEHTGQEPVLGVFAQQQPYPCVSSSTFDVSHFLGLCVILSFIVPVAVMVKNIVLEKEMRLKEQMRIMGLGDSVHFISWALVALFMSIVTSVVVAVLLKYPKVLEHAEITFIITILALYILATLTLALFISTLFTNANMATGATTIIFFFFLFPYQLSVSTKSEYITYFSLLFPQTVLCYAFWVIGQAEFSGGASWSNIDSLYFEAYGVSVKQCLIALGVDTAIFWVLSWYVSAIFPGVYGVKEKWYFPFTKAYWFPNACLKEIDDIPPDSEMEFEKEPAEKNLTVKIQRLSKVYGNGTSALDGLNIRLYEDQITALLGHNGAGKTTTMSMLCGLYSPSSGTASIYGRDLRREMRRVRDVLGVCPQQNVLFPLLTVAEQLRFFAALKGTPCSMLALAAAEILEAVNLTEKANSLAGTLSGGQKRRLCIGIALIGGSKFVILDEPTAGVDVNSRKDIWKLLQKNKVGRTILLSTHHMDEADVLSDRVAVLSEGRLVTLGSPVFLKRRFGESMQLIACKTDKKRTYSESIEAVVAQSLLNGVRCTDDNDEEITFSIPINTDSEILEQFLAWFEEKLEALHFSEYGISAPRLQQIFLKLAPSREYSIPTKKGNIFTRCCRRKKTEECEELSDLEEEEASRNEKEDKSKSTENPESTKRTTGGQDQTTQSAGTPTNQLEEETEKGNKGKTTQDVTTNKSKESLDLSINYDFPQDSLMTGRRKTWSHVKALLACRMCYTKRNFKALLFELILPVCLLLGAEVYMAVFTTPYQMTYEAEHGPLPLVHSTLGRNETNIYVNIWDEPKDHSYSKSIIESFVGKQGMGTTCTNRSKEIMDQLLEEMWSVKKSEGIYKSLQKAKCEEKIEGNWTWSLGKNESYNENVFCGCKDKYWNCTIDNYPIDRFYRTSLKSKDRIWNFSGKNISEMTLDTMFRTRGTPSYKPEFVGGYSFGHRNLRASSEKQLEETKQGWRHVLSFIHTLSDELNMTKSWESSGNETSFSKNVSMTEVIEGIVSNMDVEENVKVWFNNKVWPSFPMAQSALSNAFLRILNKDTEREDDLGIMTVNHPMHSSADSLLTNGLTEKTVIFRVLLILLVMCTLPAGFTIFLVEDRVSGSLHMQIVSGLRGRIYWITSFVFDMLIFFLGAVIVLAIYLVFGIGEFAGSVETVFSFLLVFSLYGLCAILWAYILQRFFSIAAMSFIFISLGTFFTGAVTTVIIGVFEVLMQKDASMEIFHTICCYIFFILPQYNLGIAIIRGAAVFHFRTIAGNFLSRLNREDMYDQAPIPKLLDWELMGKHCAMLGFHVVFALAMFCVVEHGMTSFRGLMEKKNAQRLMELERDREGDADDDEEVAEEKGRVAAMEKECPLVVKDLIKTYTKKQLAVRGVSFAVDAGECFGLLGLNGAGKTTCFGMLTGKLLPTSGVVSINGVSVQRGSSSAFAQVGYCPQFDALNAHLMTKENLFLFARIRAIPEKAIAPLADLLLKALHLRPYANTRTSALSGGNKRKLSVAIALISQPSLILLDEPSAGMDPGSQQFLWRVIERLRKGGKAVVMTSHSMEECEALCTRIGIMDKGRIRCLGSKQHLKNKFGEGYSLTLKLADSEQVATASDRILELLPSARIEAAHCTTVFFNIPRQSATIAKIMHVVNRLKAEVTSEDKKKVQIEDFSLSQATLDDVFFSLTEITKKETK